MTSPHPCRANSIAVAVTVSACAANPLRSAASPVAARRRSGAPASTRARRPVSVRCHTHTRPRGTRPTRPASSSCITTRRANASDARSDVKGLAVDRDLDKAVPAVDAPAYTGPTCAGCYAPLAASLVEAGRHVMC
ncbi:hypothetical protein [Embleya sp. NPDC059237]|uniref:hypothetical protein n=1 Tax=Embleya sp. NPDC059237 TaxID=3346784 RepID=UPI0036BD14AC